MRRQAWNHQSHNKQMQQNGTEGLQGKTQLCEQGDPLGDVQEI